MSLYQTIEYRIGPDGQIHETVLNGDGSSCTLATASLEMELGTVVKRELLPEYQAQGQGDLEDPLTASDGILNISSKASS